MDLKLDCLILKLDFAIYKQCDFEHVANLSMSFHASFFFSSVKWGK